jgi:inhibitor of cysteine peptidase
MRITEADNGSNIVIRKNDTFLIKLEENPTTGYRWSLDNPKFHTYFKVEYDNYVCNSDNPAPGDGGSRMFTIIAIKDGETEIVANCRQHWELSTKPIRTLKIRFFIQP